MMALFAALIQPRGLVARSGRSRYILSWVRVLLHPTLPSDPRRGRADRRGLAARGQIRRLSSASTKIGSRVVVFSRNGHDFTERFPSIAQLLHELPAKTAVLDGEVVASDADSPALSPQGISCHSTTKTK